MNIAVDAFPLTAHTSSGIANYTRKILSHLLALDRRNGYYLYRKSPIQCADIEKPNVFLRYSRKTANAVSFDNTLWLFTRGVTLMKKDNIDIFWGTRHMLPPLLPSKIKKVLTVHDLVWRYFPETMGRYNLLVMKLVAERSIKAADHIIAVSQATARSVNEIFGIPEEKITVIHNAADDYADLDEDSSATHISEKYGTNINYVLTVSTVEPRKNLSLLLRAFSKLKDKSFQLVVAGAPGWRTSAMRKEYERLGLTEDQVKFLGYVPDEEMNRLYSGARFFVFPSVYEGFGMPPLEAMASGKPIITSNASSLPEIVGDAGLQIDPLDENGWKEAIARFMSESSTRAEMRQKALKRAKRFSWEKSARQTLEVFEKVVKH